MFVGAFQHGLKDGSFNESLAQNSTSSMDDVITRVECYIKGGKVTWKRDLEMPKKKYELRKKGRA